MGSVQLRFHHPRKPLPQSLWMASAVRCEPIIPRRQREDDILSSDVVRRGDTRSFLTGLIVRRSWRSASTGPRRRRELRRAAREMNGSASAGTRRIDLTAKRRRASGYLRHCFAGGLHGHAPGAGFLGSSVLNMLGGCLTTRGQASVGGFSVTSQMIRDIGRLARAMLKIAWLASCSAHRIVGLNLRGASPIRHLQLIVKKWAAGGEGHYRRSVLPPSGRRAHITVPCRPVLEVAPSHCLRDDHALDWQDWRLRSVKVWA